MIVDYTQLDADRPYHLQLERESAEYWIVTDRWNPDTVMMRSADQDLCVRFMRAFSEKTPGATADLYSWRVAQDAVGAGKGIGRPRRHDTSGPDPSPMPRSENVYPLVRMHEQIDEAS